MQQPAEYLFLPWLPCGRIREVNRFKWDVPRWNKTRTKNNRMYSVNGICVTANWLKSIYWKAIRVLIWEDERWADLYTGGKMRDVMLVHVSIYMFQGSFSRKAKSSMVLVFSTCWSWDIDEGGVFQSLRDVWQCFEQSVEIGTLQELSIRLSGFVSCWIEKCSIIFMQFRIMCPQDMDVFSAFLAPRLMIPSQ